MSWWSGLFGGKKAPAPGSSAFASAEMVQDLLDQINELKDQLERAHEAEGNRKRSYTNKAADDAVLLKRYKDALEFYANRTKFLPAGPASRIEALQDAGRRARKALGRI